ncbi:hypothetical protein GTA08_BOTSDO08435 [Neofusicoccum parvum]|nr:hypothetical protein GTA08_BOTSDO08435 [Neofusicoccum parvum]
MPPNFQSRMALPPAVRLIVERLEDIALNFIIPTEDQSWRVYTVTSADYAALFTYLRQTGNEELFDCMESLSYDWMSYGSLLALRVPTHTHIVFTASIQFLLATSLRTVSAAAPENWFVANAVCYSSQRDASEDTTVGDHRPDLCFYFERDASPGQNSPKRARGSRHPTVVIEICSADKMRDMEALAEHYLHEGDGATRTVVGIDVTRGTFCVWRYLRFLPTRVDGREYRRCFCTERDVRWRLADDSAPPFGALQFTVRDFLPTKLPGITDGLDKEEMEALMKKTVGIPFEQMCSSWRLATPPPGYASDEEGSAEMVLSSTAENTEDDEVTGAMAPPDSEDEEDEREGSEDEESESEGEEEQQQEDEEDDDEEE